MLRLQLNRRSLFLAAGMLCFHTLLFASEDEAAMKAAVETGLGNQFNLLRIPVGRVEIMSGLSSQMEATDLARKRFSSAHVKVFQTWSDKGLVTIEQARQSDLDAIRRMGAQTVTITPTAKARAASDETLSSPDYLVIRLASCEVLKIIRNVPYKSAELSQAEEYHLVLGTYRRTPTDFSRSLGFDSDEKEYKFRSVMQLNPFTNSFSFVKADYGDPTKDGWASSNVQ